MGLDLFGPPTLQESLLDPREACRKCGLYRGAVSPKMQPHGGFQSGILVIGEFPSEPDDVAGKSWTGPPGRLLQMELDSLGIDLHKDCLLYNAINCRPTKDPNETEIAMCRSHVINAIYRHKPKAVFLMGETAVKSVIGARWTKKLGSLVKWRGWTIPDRELNTWLCPMMNPADIAEDSKAEAELTIFRSDLKQAVAKAREDLPAYSDERDGVTIIEDTYDLVQVLKCAELIAWDTETTGLKPYDTSVHKIVVIGFSTEEGIAYATPYPDLKQLKPLFQNPKIRKIAQNGKFDETWVKVLGGYEIIGTEWDTLLAAHVLDNRPGITSLKFQTYVRFGVAGYDESIEDYLKAIDEQDANSVNRVEEAMQYTQLREEMITYCGMDALFTRRLALQQMQELGA